MIAKGGSTHLEFALIKRIAIVGHFRCVRYLKPCETYFGKQEENNLSDDINEALSAELLKGKTYNI